MGIEAGKFFINLGLEGAEKTMSGLSQLNDGFKGLKGFSSEAKLAILAALAGLEQIVSTSAHFGNEITKTTAFLNVNKRELQQWENAAQNAGAAAGDMTTGLQGIQDMMNDIWAGKGPKEFFPNIMSLLSGAGENFTDAERAGQFNYFAQHPLDMMKHLLHASTLPGIDPGRLAYMLENMNVPMDIFQVNKANHAFDAKNLKIALDQTVDSKTIDKLNKLNFEWERTIHDFEKFMRLIASSDAIYKMVGGIDALAKSMTSLIEPTEKILNDISNEKIGIFEPNNKQDQNAGIISNPTTIGHGMANHYHHSKTTVVNNNQKTDGHFYFTVQDEKNLKTVKNEISSWFRKTMTNTTASMPPTVTGQ